MSTDLVGMRVHRLVDGCGCELDSGGLRMNPLLVLRVSRRDVVVGALIGAVRVGQHHT